MGAPEDRDCIISPFGTITTPLKSWHRFGVHFGLQEGGMGVGYPYPGFWEATQKDQDKALPFSLRGAVIPNSGVSCVMGEIWSLLPGDFLV